MSLHLDWCSHAAAKYSVENWHYSKTLQPAKTVKVGVWEEGQFVGCVLFTPGSGPIGSPYGLTPFEVCELSRIALKAGHKSPVSRIVRVAISMLTRSNPKLRLIVSFADPVQGHHGGIYQAGNWVYVGDTTPSTAWVDENGKVWHGRAVSPSGFKTHMGNVSRCRKTGDMEKMRLPGKHRYLYPLDEPMRRQIEPLRKPYPKRPKQATSSDQEDSGGAAPTRTLQL